MAHQEYLLSRTHIDHQARVDDFSFIELMTPVILLHEGEKRDERRDHIPYLDSVKIPTIGYGRNLFAHPLTREEVDAYNDRIEDWNVGRLDFDAINATIETMRPLQAQWARLNKINRNPAQEREFVRLDTELTKGMSALRGPENSPVLRFHEMKAKEDMNLHMITALQDARAVFPNFDHIPTDKRAALFDMIYNMGGAKVWNSFPNMRSAVAREEWDEAAAHMMDSRWFHQVKSRGPRVVGMMSHRPMDIPSARVIAQRDRRNKGVARVLAEGWGVVKRRQQLKERNAKEVATQHQRRRAHHSQLKAALDQSKKQMDSAFSIERDVDINRDQYLLDQDLKRIDEVGKRSQKLYDKARKKYETENPGFNPLNWFINPAFGEEPPENPQPYVQQPTKDKYEQYKTKKAQHFVDDDAEQSIWGAAKRRFKALKEFMSGDMDDAP